MFRYIKLVKRLEAGGRVAVTFTTEPFTAPEGEPKQKGPAQNLRFPLQRPRGKQRYLYSCLLQQAP